MADQQAPEEFKPYRQFSFVDPAWAGITYRDLAKPVGLSEDMIQEVSSTVTNLTVLGVGTSAPTSALEAASQTSPQFTITYDATHKTTFGTDSNGNMTITPTNNQVRLSYLTSGSVVYAGANGFLTQDNTNFVWDAANLALKLGDGAYLQIGTKHPVFPNTVHEIQSLSYSFNGPLRIALQNTNTGGSAHSTISTLSDEGNDSSFGVAGSGWGGGTLAAGEAFWIFNTGAGSGPGGRGMYLLNALNSYLRFGTNSNERARILSSGEWGFNTTTPRRLIDALSNTAPQLRLTYTDNSVYADQQVTSTGNLLFLPTNHTGFATAALATSATTGFLTIPGCAGAPTGVPANIPTGQLPVIYDQTNNFLYIYNGGWKKSTVYA